MFSKRALALINVIIFSVIFSMLAAVLLITVSSQARMLEASITRTKASYLVEAALVWCFDEMYENGACSDHPDEGIVWEYTTDNSVEPVVFRVIDPPMIDIATAEVPGTGGVLFEINSTYKYTFPW
jgi:hypothetical protein